MIWTEGDLTVDQAYEVGRPCDGWEGLGYNERGLAVRIDPIEALVPRYPDRAGDARSLFSSALTGEPLSRSIIAAGSVQSSPVGTVLRIRGTNLTCGCECWCSFDGTALPCSANRRTGKVEAIKKYINETRDQLRKATWPTRDELKQHIVVVLLSSALLAAFTVAADFVVREIIWGALLNGDTVLFDTTK